MLHTHKKNADKRGKPFIKSLIIGLLAGCSVWAMLLIICSGVLAKAEDPARFVLPCVFAMAGSCAFVAGFVTEKLSGKQALFAGLVAGMLLFGLVLVLSFVNLRQPMAPVTPMLKAVLGGMFPVFAVLGAVLSTAHKKGPRVPLH